ILVAARPVAGGPARVRMTCPDEDVFAGDLRFLLDDPAGVEDRVLADEQRVRADQRHGVGAVVNHAGDGPALVTDALARPRDEAAGHDHAGRRRDVGSAEADLEHGVLLGEDRQSIAGSRLYAAGVVSHSEGLPRTRGYPGEWSNQMPPTPTGLRRD